MNRPQVHPAPKPKASQPTQRPERRQCTGCVLLRSEFGAFKADMLKRTCLLEAEVLEPPKSSAQAGPADEISD